MQSCQGHDPGVTNQIRRPSNYYAKMFLATEVADSLEYYLTAEEKQTILSFVDGKDVFIPSAYCLRPHRTTKTLRKSSTATIHTLRNNLRNCTRPFVGGAVCAERERRRQHVPPDLTKMNAQRCGLVLVCFSVFLSGLCQGSQTRIMRK